MLSDVANASGGSDLIKYLTAGGVGAVFLEVVRSAFQRRKMGADTAEVISRSALSLLEPLEERAKSLQKALNNTEMELVTTQQHLADTQAELAATRRELVEAREEVRTLRAETAAGREENQ